MRAALVSILDDAPFAGRRSDVRSGSQADERFLTSRFEAERRRKPW